MDLGSVEDLESPSDFDGDAGLESPIGFPSPAKRPAQTAIRASSQPHRRIVTIGNMSLFHKIAPSRANGMRLERAQNVLEPYSSGLPTWLEASPGNHGIRVRAV